MIESRKVRPLYTNATVGRCGEIETRADGSYRVVLWHAAERVADGGQIARMARRTNVATFRGADRIVQAWLKAGRTSAKPTMHPSRSNGVDAAIYRDTFGR